MTAFSPMASWFVSVLRDALGRRLTWAELTAKRMDPATT